MPHVLIEIDGSGDLRLASEPCGTVFTVTPLSLPFLRLKVSAITPTTPIASGPSVVVTVPDASIFSVGEFVEVEQGADKDFTSIEAVVTGGPETITLKALANSYTVGVQIYQLEMFYDRLLVVDPNVGCKEVTTLSLYGSWRDQMVFRAVWAAITQAEFDFMVTDLGVTPLDPGTRDEQIDQLICDRLAELNIGSKGLFCNEIGISGPGIFSPDVDLEDGGPFVSHSCATFESQFEDVTGTATFDEYIFEIPFDTFLTRASVHTNASSAADAYITITKNDVVPIVAAGPVPPDRNLPAVTGVVKGVDLAAVPVLKGDKITVRLNLVLANTVKRAKVVLAHAPRLKNL